MSDVVVECRNLWRSFQSEAEDLQVLRGIDLSLYRGQSVSITGQSGCGKSTLLSIMGGLDVPTAGTISVAGVDISRADEEELAMFRSKTVGFVFQFHYLLKDFTALENAMLPAYMLLGDRKAAEEKALPLLDAVGLSHRLGHVPSRLSGGERQRVAIARALVNDPSILLADEPTGNLDEAGARAIEDLLFGMAEARGTTLVVVTHAPSLAARASRSLHLSEGRLLES